jgi:hypothetical protein
LDFPLRDGQLFFDSFSSEDSPHGKGRRFFGRDFPSFDESGGYIVDTQYEQRKQ